MSKVKPAGDARGTEFVCQGKDAQAVYVAGSFNDWSPEAHPMKRDKSGLWTARIDLPPGRYEFKFVVDGEWVCEPACDAQGLECPKCVPNPFGTMDRFVDVA